MSSNRRIPKRSIIGSIVCVKSRDGFWRQGTITGIRSDENSLMPFFKNFKVDLAGQADLRSEESFYSEDDIIGPSFQSLLPRNTKLSKGQDIFVTQGGREVKGVVVTHDTQEDCVELLGEGVGTIIKPLEEIRLMESRKSARLINSDTDFSRMADINICKERRKMKDGQNRRRLHSMSSFPDKKDLPRMRPISDTGPSASIDVPLSRKRRTSESRLDMESGYSSGCSSSGYSSSLSSSLLKSRDDLINSSFLRSGEDIRECTAAMVLMNLSVSPNDRWTVPSHFTPTLQSSPVSSDSALDEDEPVKKVQRSSIVMHKCTWRGCSHITRDLDKIETHVRGHLGRPEPGPEDDRDFEEEFYYTEVDTDQQDLNEIENDEINILDADFIIDQQPSTAATTEIQTNSTIQGSQSTTAVPPSLLATSAPSNLGLLGYDLQKSIAEHLDMAKPSTALYLISGQPLNRPQQPLLDPEQGWMNKRLVSIVPKPAGKPSKPFVFTPPGQSPGLSPGQTPGKSDRKCRKLFGLEQKDQWCTQCKWKKACARFT